MTAVAEESTKKAKKAAQTATDGQEAPALSPPKPGEPGFDWQAEYVGEKVFIYTTPEDTTTRHGEPYGGVVIGLAAISEDRQPDFDFFRETRKKPQFEQILDMLEEIVASETALKLIGPLKTGPIQVMWEAWTKWNKTTGELERSTAS